MQGFEVQVWIFWFGVCIDQSWLGIVVVIVGLDSGLEETPGFTSVFCLR